MNAYSTHILWKNAQITEIQGQAKQNLERACGKKDWQLQRKMLCTVLNAES